MFLVLVMTVAITIVVLAGTAFLFWRAIGGLNRLANEEARILQTGTPARAQILQVQRGGMTVTTFGHRRLEVIVTMQVQLPNVAPYTTHVRTLLSELNIPQIQPGAWVQVRIDPTNPQRVAIEGFGVAAAQPGPTGGFGQPAAAPAGGEYGQSHMAQPGFVPAAPAAGFKLSSGVNIGLAIAAVGALLGVIAVIVVVVWTMGVGGPSDVCQQARDCCRQMSLNSSACDSFTKQTGPIADKTCEETLASYKMAGVCK
jgi:hypothetical protein